MLKKLLPVVLALFLARSVSAIDTSEDWNCADSTNITCDLTWTEQSNDLEITGNKVNRVAGVWIDDATIATTSDCTNSGSIDLSVVVTAAASESSGVVWFYSDTSNYSAAFMDSGNVCIINVVAGVQADNCTSVSVTPASSYTLLVEIRDEFAYAYLDGVFRIGASVSPASPTSVVGIYDGGAANPGDGPSMDDFRCRDVSQVRSPMIKADDCSGGQQLINGGMIN